jgi:hypothetical protein
VSLFQCERCGCCDNTALSAIVPMRMPDIFDWSGIEDRKSLALCSACGPKKYADGNATGYGRWHNQFPRVFLPMGLFKTAQNGNLEHVDTGEEDFMKYALPTEHMELDGGL